MSSPVRTLTGTEEVVLFCDAEEFTGVSEAWLRPRLRLNPACGEVDLFERSGLMVYLDDEPIEDLYLEDIVDGWGEGTTLCTYGDGGIIGGGSSLIGGWLEDYAPEIRHQLTWIGSPPEDLRGMALGKIIEGKDGWQPQAHERFEVTSPHLSSAVEQDVADVLALAGQARTVTLNAVVVRGDA